MEYITKSFKETFLLGQKFATKLTGGEVIALFGDLGGGKTTFTKGIASGLGIDKEITSPTFVISKSYNFDKKKLIHIDTYRLKSVEDFESIGFFENINSDSIVVIEWPEKIWSKIKDIAIKIDFSYIDENKRKIVIGVR